MSFPKNEKGFTLLEALLVVVIIAIIAAVAIPRFMFARSTAEADTCANNRAIINTQAERWYMENGAWPSYNALTSDTEYFPDGPPACPAGGTYSFDTNNRATCSVHGAGGGGS